MTKTVLILACAMFAVSACGKKSKGSGTTAAAISYYQSDSACYEIKTNKKVDMDKCKGVTYYMEYGSCYKKSDDTAVDNFDLCTKSLGEYFYMDNNCTSKDTKGAVSSNLCDSTSKSGYGYDNAGYCIDKKTSKRVSDTNCENANDRYERNGPICYDTYTGWSTEMYHCDDSDSNGDNKICRGEYVKIDFYGYFAGYITCNSSGSNCRGQNLWNPRTSDYETCN